jgi:hypothetical protein
MRVHDRQPYDGVGVGRTPLLDKACLRALSLASSRKDLLSTFETRCVTFKSTLSRLRPEDWSLLAAHATGPQPIRVWVDRITAEHAMHGWDIRSSFDAEATFLPTSLQPLCDMAVRAVRRAFRPDPLRSSPIRYRFIVNAPYAVTHDLVLSSDGGRYQGLPEADGGCHFRG